jgi:cysteine desulfurase
MMPWLVDHVGNPHSIHTPGLKARQAVEQAREQITELLCLDDPAQVIFTSGATESCNTILKLSDPNNAEISPFEHSALRVPASHQQIPLIPNQGHNLTFTPEKTHIVTACTNETGAIQTAASPWICDATQAIGKINFNARMPQMTAFSAHKFGGPLGIGVLILKDPSLLNEHNALLAGGGHESGRRAGTLNVPAIIGLAAALKIALGDQDQNATHTQLLREVILNELQPERINDSSNQSPHILSLVFPKVTAQTLVIELDAHGFSVSSGSACSSGSTEPSPVLLALGLSPAEALSTLRISFGSQNTVDSTAGLARTLKSILAKF